jgi:hypothetical protein
VTRTPDLRPHYIFRGTVLHHFASYGETPQPVAVVGGFAPRLNLSVRATAPANVKLERHALQYADSLLRHALQKRSGIRNSL